MSKTYYVIGLDLGLKGALAVMNTAGELVTFVEMPVTLDSNSKQKVDVIALRNWLEEEKFTPDNVALICMERVHSFGQEMRSALFSFGKGTGRVEALLELGGFAYVQVTPQAWKAKILHGTPKDKKAALGYVYSRYPKAQIGKHDGLADAICMAEYARYSLLPEEQPCG